MGELARALAALDPSTPVPEPVPVCAVPGAVLLPSLLQPHEAEALATPVLAAAMQVVILTVAASKLSGEVNEWRQSPPGQYWGVCGARFLENVVSFSGCALILATAAAPPLARRLS